jgi:arsenic resistance protein ArsH
VFDPQGLPLKDTLNLSDGEDGGTDDHAKVRELRDLIIWSEANFWCSPEQHGNLTGVMKTMIDHVPLGLGSVRPTQGKILAVSQVRLVFWYSLTRPLLIFFPCTQVNGGSQSFNAVNALRILGRWMRMFTIPNQASLPKAWTQFDKQGRMLASSNRDRLVDVVEELVKVSCIMRGSEAILSSRWSERTEIQNFGQLRSQAEKESGGK